MNEYTLIPVKGSPRGALVDAQDAHVANREWSLHGKAYAVRRVGGRRVVKMEWDILGRPRLGLIIDHINGNPLDNRRSNLRLATSSQNSINRKPKCARHGYYGVKVETFGGGTVKYRGEARIDGLLHVTPWVDSAEVAARHRDELAAKVHGEFGVYNFPRPEFPRARVARAHAHFQPIDRTGTD